jgi:hypothetical protein
LDIEVIVCAYLRDAHAVQRQLKTGVPGYARLVHLGDMHLLYAQTKATPFRNQLEYACAIIGSACAIIVGAVRFADIQTS